MQGPASFSKSSAPLARVKIAERDFSRRQKALLEGIFGFFSDEFARSLEQMLNELEQQLFRSAEQARSNEVQRALLEAQKRIHERRSQVTPQFLAQVETALATLSDPPPPKVEDQARPQFSELSLVDTSTMDETVALREIATRGEIRNSLSLFLLGQRMGVVAGRPAFDAEHLPVGPHRLCQMLRSVVAGFELDAEQCGQIYRQFDRSVMQHLTPFYEALNNYLIREQVLPNLTYVPPRSKQAAARKRAQQPSAPAPSAPPADTDAGGELPAGLPDMNSMPARGGRAFPTPPPGMAVAPAARMPASPAHLFPPAAPSAPSAPPPGPGAMPRTPPASGAAAAPAARKGMFPPPGSIGTGAAPTLPPHAAPDAPDTVPWNNLIPSSPAEQAAPDAELFDTLRRLLAGRRSLLGKLKSPSGAAAHAPKQVASPDLVQQCLSQIQQELAGDTAPAAPLPFAQVKTHLLNQLARTAQDGPAPTLSDTQGDTVDLVGMLFDHIGQEVSPQSPAGSLLGHLQVPLLRVALQDEGFFTDHDHPARQMLNAIAETSAYLSSDDEVDRNLIQKMSHLVQRATQEYSGDNALFSDLMSDLTSHLSTQQRKAEVSERRHVEAARGREKLEIARLQAEEAIDGVLEGKDVPRFLRTLLEQVWTDVLALALLRGGESSPAFQQQIALVKRLVDATMQRHASGQPVIEPTEASRMREEIESSLTQVGHASEDASEVSARMLAAATSASENEADADPASRTELAIKLRSRARFGQDAQGGRQAEVKTIPKTAPLSPEEKTWHDRVKRMPYGTWFDFTINQQGDRARRRMSWYSTVTDHCLFVNHRGQRAGDYTLSWLARELERGNVKLVEPERGSIVDRAWSAIVRTLRSFAGQGAQAPQAATAK